VIAGSSNRQLFCQWAARQTHVNTVDKNEHRFIYTR